VFELLQSLRRLSTPSGRGAMGEPGIDAKSLAEPFAEVEHGSLLAEERVSVGPCTRPGHNKRQRRPLRGIISRPPAIPSSRCRQITGGVPYGGSFPPRRDPGHARNAKRGVVA